MNDIVAQCLSHINFRPMPQQWTKQPKPTYCYGGKHIMKVHETKLSAAVSSMWTLTQMTQIIVFRFAQ